MVTGRGVLAGKPAPSSRRRGPGGGRCPLPAAPRCAVSAGLLRYRGDSMGSMPPGEFQVDSETREVRRRGSVRTVGLGSARVWT